MIGNKSQYTGQLLPVSSNYFVTKYIHKSFCTLIPSAFNFYDSEATHRKFPISLRYNMPIFRLM